MLTHILLLTPYIAIVASLSLTGIVLATCLSQRTPRMKGFDALEPAGAP